MMNYRFTSSVAVALIALAVTSCDQKTNGTGGGTAAGPAPAAAGGEVSKRGSIEVTARLVEIPEGAIFKRDLYDYTGILKYEVLKVHRGEVKTNVIFVGHYDPWKPRGEAADKRVPDIGGSVKRFQAGDTHRLALEAPLDNYFMGGIVNKYFGQDTGDLYWAVWTDAAGD